MKKAYYMFKSCSKGVVGCLSILILILSKGASPHQASICRCDTAVISQTPHGELSEKLTSWAERLQFPEGVYNTGTDPNHASSPEIMVRGVRSRIAFGFTSTEQLYARSEHELTWHDWTPQSLEVGTWQEHRVGRQLTQGWFPRGGSFRTWGAG